MNIGFDAKRLFLNNRGLGNYARTLIMNLLQYARDNEYYLYTPELRDGLVSKELLEDSLTHIRSPKGRGRLITSYWRTVSLGHVLARDQLDIFHGLSHEIPLTINRAGAKVVTTVHDLIFVRHPEFYNPIDRWIYYKKVKQAIHRSDKIIAISEQTKRDVIDEFPLAKGKIEVVYQTCNSAFYQKRTDEEKEAVQARYHLPDRYLLFVGALNENKNVEVIIRAMNENRDIGLHLVIIGKGHQYREKLCHLLDKLDMMYAVHFASDVAHPSPKELSVIYQLARALVFPSYYEGFGIPIIEARFSGIPVLASNSSCLHEAGEDSAMYFPPDDYAALAGLISDLQNDNERAMDPPLKFSAEKVTSDLVSLYNSLK